MVVARKEFLQQSGSYKSCDVREYKQYVDLPPDVVKEQVSSSLSDDGFLTIRAPYKGNEILLTERPYQHIEESGPKYELHRPEQKSKHFSEEDSSVSNQIIPLDEELPPSKEKNESKYDSQNSAV